MKPAKVAESKTFRKRDSILHYGELIEGNKNAPSSVRNNYTFSFSLVPVTNLRVIVIVKPSQFWRSLPGERERERGGKWILRAVGRVVSMLESRFSSRFETSPGIFCSFNLFIRWLDK